MTARREDQGREAFELPRQTPYGPYRRQNVIYPDVYKRRSEAAEQSADQSRSAQAHASARQIAVCVAAVCALITLSILWFNQNGAIARNAVAIDNISDEIHELSVDAEVAAERIAQAGAGDRIEKRALELGMRKLESAQ